MSGVLSSPPSARGRREAATLTGARKMCRCFEYDTNTRNEEITAMLRRGTRLDDAVRVGPERCSQLADGVARERPRRVAVGEVAGVDLGRPVHEQRHHDRGDVREHEPRRARVRAVEAARSLLSSRRVGESDDAEDAEADEHRDGEEVLEEPHPRVGADERDVEAPAEERAVGLDDREQQDREAPHREEVREARHRPLQELALTRDLHQLRLGVRAEPLQRPGAGAPGPEQPPQPPEAGPAIVKQAAVMPRPRTSRSAVIGACPVVASSVTGRGAGGSSPRSGSASGRAGPGTWS